MSLYLLEVSSVFVNTSVIFKWFASFSERKIFIYNLARRTLLVKILDMISILKLAQKHFVCCKI